MFVTSEQITTSKISVNSVPINVVKQTVFVNSL